MNNFSFSTIYLCFIACSVILTSDVVFAQGTGMFSSKTDVTVGTAPYAVVTRDIDGDNDIDIVTANNTSGDITVLLNQGNDVYSDTSYTAGTAPSAIAAGDVDTDNDIDIIVANSSSNNVSIFLNDGSGTFGNAISVASFHSNPVSITLCDLNVDNKPDIILANQTSGTISWLQNDGNGNFSYPVIHQLAVGIFPSAVVSFRKDEDNDDDLVYVSTGDNTITILSNDSASVSPITISNVGNGPTSLSVGDIDGDGDEDILVGNNNIDSVTVVKNNGNGTFASPVNYFSKGTGAYSIDAKDINSDGSIDIVVANSDSNSVSVLFNNGNGIFTDAVKYNAGNTPRGITLTDIDNDGDNDIITANSGASTISILKNRNPKMELSTSTISFGEVLVYLSQTDSIIIRNTGTAELILTSVVSSDAAFSVSPQSDTLAAGDSAKFMITYSPLTDGISSGYIIFNNNTISSPDSLTVSGEGIFQNISVTNVTPSGNAINRNKSTDISITFSVPVDTSTLNATTVLVDGSISGSHSGTLTKTPVSVTFNPDDNFESGEIVTVRIKNSVRSAYSDTLLNGFQWSFGVSSSSASGIFASISSSAAGTSPVAIAKGDFDNDGDLDFAVANNTSLNVSIFSNSGSGTFTKTNVTAGTDPVDIAAVDIERDGDLDLVLQNNSGTINILTNVNGVFSVTATLSADANGSNTLSYSDIDNDGDVDFVTGRSSDVIVMTKNDTGYLRSSYFTVRSSLYSVSVADFSGDGYGDIIAANHGDVPGTFSYFKNNGDGSFALEASISTNGNTPFNITSLNVDGDSDMDIIVANEGSNSIAIFKNSNGGTFTFFDSINVGNSPQSIATGDFDGDGDIDVATANYNSSTVSILRNNANGDYSTSLTVNLGSGAKPRAISAGDFDGDGALDLAVASHLTNKVTILTGASFYRTFKADTLMGKKANSLKQKKNQAKPLPNVGNWRDTVFARTDSKNGITFGISTTDKTLAKTIGWIRFKKGGDMLGFYSVIDSDSTYNAPFDTVRKSGSNKKKQFVKELKAQAKSYTNPLAQAFGVFKLNLYSSKKGVTPTGLDSLTYIKNGSPWSGMTLSQISNRIDTVLTFYKTKKLYDSTAAVKGSTQLERLRVLLNEINGAFYDSIDATNGDTVTSDGLKFKGVVGLHTITYLKRISGKVENLNEFSEKESVPEEFSLHQNYPNPFNPQTVIGFSLVAVSNVTLKIYNVLGQEVATLLNNEAMEEGTHELQFDASHLSSGVYFFRLNAQGENGTSFMLAKKMVLMK